MSRTALPSRPQKRLWKPRKVPRQARSRATYDAIVQACARILRESGLAAITTNAVAARAGVSVGSLYEFFPGREAILAAMVEQRLGMLAPEVAAALQATRSLDSEAGVRLLIARLVDLVAADRALFRLLLHDAPILRELPATRQALGAFAALGRAGAMRAGTRLALPAPEVDAWLIGRMVASAVLDLAFLDDPAHDRSLLVHELARLTYRMLFARDLRDAPGDAREAPAERDVSASAPASRATRATTSAVRAARGRPSLPRARPRVP